jgi:hypothetical protein
MNRWLKTILIYVGVISVIEITLAIIIVFAEVTVPYAIRGLLTILPYFAMLIHFGKFIENELARRKYYTYLGIIIGVVFLLHTLPTILSNTRANTWLVFIGNVIVFASIFTMLFDLARTLKSTNDKASRILRGIAIFGSIFMGLTAVVLAIVGVTDGFDV